jgi:periplasmic protein TonB
MAMLWKSLDAGQYPGQGGDIGEKSDTDSSSGPTVSLDSKDSRFASYLMGVKRRIESVWSYPPDARSLTGNLVITFGITRDGRLSDLQLTQTSGIAPLDNEAIRAIRLANPFGPFSEQMHFERLNIRAAFYYHVSRASLRHQ